MDRFDEIMVLAAEAVRAVAGPPPQPGVVPAAADVLAEGQLLDHGLVVVRRVDRHERRGRVVGGVEHNLRHEIINVIALFT